MISPALFACINEMFVLVNTCCGCDDRGEGKEKKTNELTLNFNQHHKRKLYFYCGEILRLSTSDLGIFQLIEVDFIFGKNTVNFAACLI